MARTAVWFSLCALFFPLAFAQLKIMPLGDSTTAITCWRGVLAQELRTAGAENFQFVGTQRSTCGDNGGHEGYPAIKATAAQSGPNIGGAPWDQNKLPPILAALHPDVVMILLGVNDMAFRGDPSKITAAFGKLVDQMRADNPNVQVVVAQIPPATLTDVRPLDVAIPPWAAAKSTPESPVTVVDCFTGFDASADTRDGVHFNDRGDQKVAACFAPELYRIITEDAGSGGAPAASV
ncbi:SGNH hydrolase [Eremomyces bilateralis CBS 781.70]|uniref:SGNH hydrolase n=1 Tax=Eremomyces bilateralis CBS 781.70 TaxID=1392243 RepID=A0A6G1FQ51_9PEZI|nr:SGNH hydrolase [Eremomyces bilateralis CBS 781.70]KAF1807893.1 SGNH hydrolase [Eremomyces bilateralis CBS 781.70]